MHDNYNLTIQSKDGFTLQAVQNVSINTAYQILPHLLEDLVHRGHGSVSWDRFDNHVDTDRNNVRAWFKDHDPFWFDPISNEGQSSVFGLSVHMTHS